MSRTDSGTTVRRVRPQPNVYSVLAIIATLVLGAGVGYVWHKNLEQTKGEFENAQAADGSNPFYIIDPPKSGE
jgi:hypothetical protein